MFTEDDAAEILEYLEWKDSLCPGCGQPKHIGFDKAHEGMFKATPLRCHACKVQRVASKDVDDSDGLYTVVEFVG